MAGAARSWARADSFVAAIAASASKAAAVRLSLLIAIL
jgi:hypothetical protein